MSRKLYVANLCHMVEKAELEKLFANHGTVRLAEVIDQLKTADSTGTGLVEMDSEEQGEAAISALNGMQHRGFALIVGWDQPGQREGVSRTHMFESMNIPDDAELHGGGLT
jgi:cold-inducible RNA-binding protein